MTDGQNIKDGFFSLLWTFNGGAGNIFTSGFITTTLGLFISSSGERHTFIRRQMIRETQKAEQVDYFELPATLIVLVFSFFAVQFLMVEDTNIYTEYKLRHKEFMP